MAEVAVQQDQQAAAQPEAVTVRDIPTRKTLPDGSHLLAETSAYLVSSSNGSRISSSSTSLSITLYATHSSSSPSL
jgi:hypothetical protein